MSCLRFKLLNKFKQKPIQYDDFTDLKTKYDEVNDVATEQKKTITELVDDVIDKTNPFQNVSIEDTWIRRRHI